MQNAQPQAQKPKKPVVGETRKYSDHEGGPSFEVKFKSDTEVVIKRTGEPNILRQIVNKYGNIRMVDGHMKKTADDLLWFLFDLTESN